MIKLLGFVGLLGVGAWFGLGKIEAEAIYPFDKTRVSPASAGLHGVRELEVKTDNNSLILWVADPQPGRPVILYFHGNAGNLAIRTGRFGRLLKRGYGLIAPAYRGSSGSTGAPSEKKLSRDAAHVYRHMDSLIEGVTQESTVVYGESLGTGVALKLIAELPAPMPAGVVLEAPYTSLPDVVSNLHPQLESLIPYMTNIWDSRQNVAMLTAPLLVLHGTEDTLIPIEQGRQIHAAAPSVSKRFLAVKGAGHTDIWRSDVLPVLWRFIDRAYADSTR